MVSSNTAPASAPGDEFPPSYDEAVASDYTSAEAVPASAPAAAPTSHAAPAPVPAPAPASTQTQPPAPASIQASPRPRPPHLPSYHPTEPAQRARIGTPSSYSVAESTSSTPPPPIGPSDSQRPLPRGWIRQFDPSRRMYFYVDQRASNGAGRSTWVHPYSDPQYLASVNPDKRRVIEWDNTLQWMRSQGVDTYMATLPPDVSAAQEALRTGASSSVPQVGDWNRKSSRKARKTLERRSESPVQAQARLSRAFSEASRTGRPVFLQRDVDGKDVVVLPARATPPGVPDQFLYLIQDQRLKCIRSQVGNGQPMVVHKNRNGAVVGGLVGGAILGALLI